MQQQPDDFERSAGQYDLRRFQTGCMCRHRRCVGRSPDPHDLVAPKPQIAQTSWPVSTVSPGSSARSRANQSGEIGLRQPCRRGNIEGDRRKPRRPTSWRRDRSCAGSRASCGYAEQCEHARGGGGELFMRGSAHAGLPGQVSAARSACGKLRTSWPPHSRVVPPSAFIRPPTNPWCGKSGTSGGVGGG